MAAHQRSRVGGGSQPGGQSHLLQRQNRERPGPAAQEVAAAAAAAAAAAGEAARDQRRGAAEERAEAEQGHVEPELQVRTDAREPARHPEEAENPEVLEEKHQPGSGGQW